jgi:putative ABC transport system permease protein
VIALAVRSLAQRGLRSALTGLAVLLGVAMTAGTYVQTDRIHDAFAEIAATGNRGTDVRVSAQSAFDSDLGGLPQIPAAWLTRIRATAGVAQADGELVQTGALVVRGRAVMPSFAPSLVLSAVAAPFSPMRYVRGHAPTDPGQVAVDADLAARQHLVLGRQVHVSTRYGTRTARLVGVARYGDAASIGGATLIVATRDTVERWYHARGRLTGIMARAVPGVTPSQLAARVRAALPPTARVQTGLENTRDVTRQTDEAMAFLSPALLTLAGAALLVGAFIIFNTFSITVAQRTREFGLLRALGATRRQLLGAVTLEALVIGVAASVLGLLAGLGIAAGMGALFDAAGFGIPAGGAHLATRTIVVGLTVGVVVTLLAAVIPALRATRVPPVAAMRVDPAPRVRRSRRTPVIAVLVAIVGLAALLQGLFGGGPAAGRLSALAGGAVLLFVAAALAARYVVEPIAGLLGLPLERLFAEPGRLARENAMRNPARTASTAAALMVGLGLVVFVAVFAAGLKSSIGGSLDELVRANVVVSASGVQTVPSGARSAIANVPGVRGVVAYYGDRIEVNGAKVNSLTDTLDGVDATQLLDVYRPHWLGGADDRVVARLHGRGALVEEQFAKTHRIRVGETFAVATPTGRRGTLRALAMFRDPQILQGVIVDTAAFDRLSEMRDPFAYFLAAGPGISDASLRARVAIALEPFPSATARTNAGYRAMIGDNVDRIVYLLYALLAMSLVISLFGIVNSLFLSIHERTREFGLLRSVGATQGQVRRVVRYESVITAVIGALLGTVVGILFAALATAALDDLGLGFSLPAGQLLIFMVLAVVVGIAGAALPARRAAAVDVLAAMREE